jgi:hypothetical protein
VTVMPQAGRQAAHVILDAVSVYDPAMPAPMTVVDRAFHRLNEVDAVGVRLTDDGEVVVDASDLLGGTIVVVQWLVEALARERGEGREQVIADARGFLDE